MAPEQDLLIEMAGVSYSYPNGVNAVSDLSLSVSRCERLGIVGPSGCGKSTLLRLIAELAEPSSGLITRNFQHDRERAQVTMVHQGDTLLPWLTVRRNVGLYFSLHRGFMPKAKVGELVSELLYMVGLEKFANAFPRELSGGMRRRANFLAAIAPHPQLLLLDEPFSSVDEPTRVEIHQQVQEILDTFRITTILVTHDLAEAVSLMDTVAILSARPARVAQLSPVHLDRSSDLLETRGTSEFLDTYGRLWDSLSHEIRAGHVATGDRDAATPQPRRLTAPAPPGLRRVWK